MELVDRMAEAFITVELIGAVFTFFAYVAHSAVKS